MLSEAWFEFDMPLGLVEMSVTNSIIAPLPCAMEVDAAKVAFESFGEVFRVKRLEKFKSFVQALERT